MQINPKIIKKQFEKSMGKYNENAIVQKFTAQKLVTNLAGIKNNFNNVLELGSGTGLLTEEFVKNIKFKNYYANDLTEKSKKYLSQIIPEFTFICGNAQKITSSKKMDLIISNAMFQWFNNLEKISKHLKNILNNEGILAFSTFLPENYIEIREISGLSLNYKSIDELKSIFSKDFEILYTEEFKYIMNFSNPLEILAHMKNTGVNSLNMKQWTFKEVKKFCEKYKSEYPELTLTYSPVIVICKKFT